MGKSNGGKIAIGTLVAGIAGYVTGVLTAPKSGKETRKDIREAASKARAEAEHKLKALHSEISDLIDQGKAAANTMQDKAKKQLNELIETAQKAKEKAREMLSAIHEGDAEDKDLQVAIDDVNKAIAHLKKYLQNEKTKA